MQIPLEVTRGRSIKNKLKLKTWQHIVCNSQLTKQYIDQSYGITSKVIYPPVDTQIFQVGQKEKAIISVGRFFGETHGKKQEFLIETFKKLHDKGLTSWQLWLVGSVFNQEYYQKLQEQSKNYPIRIYGDMPFTELVHLYAKASIYWHAQGYMETEARFMEHFGMTTVEAMASGCVPIVIGNGGQTEIVTNHEDGVLWNSAEEFMTASEKLMADEKLLQTMATKAKEKSKTFSKERFQKELEALLIS